MKRIIVAPDSFKESLTAAKVAFYIAEGIHKVLPEAEVIQIPLSDGGEGLIDALVSGTGGRFISRKVTGPLGEEVTARFGILGDNRTAVIEMAEASGLALVPRERRNPMVTTTYGTGELIKAALDLRCRRMIVGIGGSATNDGGSGMAEALGVRLLDADGHVIGRGAEGLLRLSSIDMSAVDPRLSQTEILVACDVTNPLYGPTGASFVYGPQKGASPEMLPVMDQALFNLARVIKRDLNLEVEGIAGAGAAGGLGAGLMAFAGGKLCSGLRMVLEILDFESRLAGGVDLVITGEGQINDQTLFGKVPAGVASLAKKYDLPVLAIVGSIGPGAEKVYEAGIDAIMSITPGPINLDEAMTRAGELVSDATARVMRMIMLGNRR
ncbi:MAG: glycerate kinase [Bacillota bacterium]